MAVQPGFCQTWSETGSTGFLVLRLIFKFMVARNEECFVFKLYYILNLAYS